MSDSRYIRLGIMIFLTGSFFVAELVVGNVSRSLALVADSFHMLSDVLSMIVGVVAIKIAKKPRTSKLTFGYKRAEVVGGLVNGVFLLALCFTIVIDAIERFFEPKPVEQPQLLLIVACAGLLINIIGVLLFCGHGGHSHAGHNHDHKEHKGDYKKEKPAEKNHDDHDHKHDRGHDDEQGQTHNEQIDKALDDADVLMKKDVGRGATIQSVFLHVLGDALGSVAVIISALFIWLTEYPWRFYIDPAISIVVVCILIYSCVGLIRSTLVVIMQGVPKGTDVAQIEAEILNLGGVVAAHDLHIWQLDEERSVASIHVVCTNRDTWPKLGPQVRKILHKAGIHSATIQAEFESDQITLHKAKTELLEKEGVLEDSEDETTGSTEESDITVVAIAVANACQTPCVSPNCKDLQCC